MTSSCGRNEVNRIISQRTASAASSALIPKHDGKLKSSNGATGRGSTDGRWPAFGSCGGLEGDVVSERFELFDETAGCAFGAAVGEVVAAGFAVELAGCEHVPAAMMMECLTAPRARPWPRRGRRR
jgi:hypothetical protein